MSETLKPCPFCGHAAVMPRPHDTRAFVECTGKFAFEDGPDCGARTGYYSTEAEAAAAWNRRASPPQPDALSVYRARCDILPQKGETVTLPGDPRFELVPPQGEMNAELWESTSALRWLLPRDVRAPRRLQQAWRDQSTGRTEWRDVPLVEEVEE
jgi:hypothetical protein